MFFRCSVRLTSVTRSVHTDRAGRPFDSHDRCRPRDISGAKASSGKAR